MAFVSRSSVLYITTFTRVIVMVTHQSVVSERGTYFEEFLEIGAAGGEHHLVRLEPVPFARQRHIDEVLIIAQRLELRCYICLKIVPSQTELLVATQFCTFHYL